MAMLIEMRAIASCLSDARIEPTSSFTQLFFAINPYQQSAYVKHMSSIILAFKKEQQLSLLISVMVKTLRWYVANMKIISTKKAL